MIKKTAVQLGVVIRGLLFIGFTVQILLGAGWMWGNFLQVQDFGEPESALYRGLMDLTGGCPQILYLLQTGAAFFAVYYFLEKLGRCLGRYSDEPVFTGSAGRLPEDDLWACSGEPKSRKGWHRRLRAVWRTLALLSSPFAMQCHLALLPCSFLGSLFLLLLSFGMQAADRRSTWGKWDKAAVGSAVRNGRIRRLRFLVLAVLCCVMSLLLSGAADSGAEKRPGRSVEAALASRFAWPTIWNDQDNWTEDLREITWDVLWEAAYCPGNMELVEAAVEERADPGAAKDYYMQMAGVGWERHASMIIRQIGWDVLGYAVTPVIVRLQLAGEAYDSYTGRNYEVMRGNMPVLTRDYVDYSCWWFVMALILTIVSVLLQMLQGKGPDLRRAAGPILTGLFFSGILVAILTMRGAGLMDYKNTIAINQLWLAFVLLEGQAAGRDGKYDIPGEGE